MSVGTNPALHLLVHAKQEALKGIFVIIRNDEIVPGAFVSTRIVCCYFGALTSRRRVSTEIQFYRPSLFSYVTDNDAHDRLKSTVNHPLVELCVSLLLQLC